MRNSNSSLCSLRVAAFLALAWLGAFCSRAAAEDLEREPARYLASASGGLALRLTENADLGQSRLAPLFTSALVGHVLPGRGYRHGFGLGASLNLGRDGGYVEPVYAGQQLVLMPTYLGYWNLNRDLLALGHAGLPVVVRGGRSLGVEAGFLLGYRVFAGAGVFGELDVDGFAIAGSSLSLLTSFQLGVIVDYEVLP